jgi:hypothetical protein
MNIRTSSLLCSVLALLVASARADEAPATPAPAAVEPAAPAVSTILAPAFVSQYMFRGNRLGGPSFEPYVEVDYGSLGVGVWCNFPIEDKVIGQSDPEIDPYAYYTITINDSLSVVPGFTWYNYPNADESNGFFKSSFEPSIALNYTIAGLKLTPKLYYDVILDGPTYEITAAYAVPLKEIGSELDFTAVAGTYMVRDYAKGADPRVKNWGDYYLIGVAMPFQITKESKLTVGVAYTKGTGNFLKQGSDPKFVNTAAVGRGVVTLTYAWTF